MKLPQTFLDEMQSLLGEAYEAFLASYDQPRTHGLRVNTLKITPEAFQSISPVPLEPVPWCPDGFYYDGQEWLTRHPYYHAGLFYIQEPSAMAPVPLLSPQPDDTVLDLCSAPGGKTVQIASHTGDRGLLIANDLNFNRLKAVIRNLERYGVTRGVVISNDQETLARLLKGRIDRLLIDAPCSGEGMFRKDEKMVRSYEQDDVSRYPKTQASLLACGADMMVPGGTMVYSTCTFNVRENDERVRELAGSGVMTLERMERMMPHRIRGEGHFISLLSRGEQGTAKPFAHPEATRAPEAFESFMEKMLTHPLQGYFRVHADKLYLSPVHEADLQGLNVIRNGWYLGDLKKGRFEPSHALAMGLMPEKVRRTVDFPADAPEVLSYLKGETVLAEGEPGYVLVTVDGYPLGWAKWDRGILKNRYPSAMRILK